MAHPKLRSIGSADGFILPLTMMMLLVLSLFCFQGLYQLNLNQSELIEQRTETQNFFIFQSAANDLDVLLQSTADQQGSGTVTESGTLVNYRFKLISSNQFQITITDKSKSDSTLSASYVYNKETKQIEQWVNQ